MGLFATAQAPGQALSNNQAHGCGNVKGGNSHIAQTGQGFRRAVGVQGGKHQVPRLGSFNGNGGGVQVPNFTNHHDIRVLPQEGAQGSGEVQAHFGVHVDLVDAFQVDLHRVFCRGNVALRRVENVQACIQGNGLTAPRGAGYQDHPLGLGQGFQVKFFLILFISQGINAQFGAAGVENPQYDFLSPQGG